MRLLQCGDLKRRFGVSLRLLTCPSCLARWHPHIHAIVADGLFRRNGVFHVMLQHLQTLRELFWARLLRMLVREKVIDQAFVGMLLKWRYASGFNVDNSVRIAREDEKGITALAQHIPEKSFQLFRYYGWYSNRMRGERKKLEERSCAGKQEIETVDISKLTMIDVADYKPRRIPHPLCRSL